MRSEIFLPLLHIDTRDPHFFSLFFNYRHFFLFFPKIDRSFLILSPLRGHKPNPPGYPKSLKTIGDHLKKRRLDLGLLQREVAQRIGVDETTIYLCERDRVKPSLAQIPKIIDFLGRDPFKKETESLGERIREYRRVHGLSQRKLAEQLGVNQTKLAGWERGEHQPSKMLLDNLSKSRIPPY